MSERLLPSRPDGGAPQRRTPPFVVIARLLLLLAAAAALVSGVVRARTHDRAVATAVDRFVCPMHPEVVSPVPGDCPICNMALVPAGEHEHMAMATGGEIVATAEQRVVAEQLRAAAWLGADGEGTAVVYKDDLVGLAADEPSLFFGGSSPNMGIDAQLVPGSQSPIDSSMVNVRFRLDKATRRLEGAAGLIDVGSLQVGIRARKLLVVPTSAVLYSASGPYVLAASDPGDAFTKRAIQVGRILDSGYVGERAGNEQGATVILSGLQEGERVIAGYTFFVDAERRLRQASGTGEERIR